MRLEMRELRISREIEKLKEGAKKGG